MMHGWQSESTDGLMDRKLVGAVFLGVVAVVAATTAGCSVV